MTKATGTDSIGPRLLKIAAAEIADSVTFICNCSINQSLFPDKWKDAKIFPLLKNGLCDNVNVDQYLFYLKFSKNTSIFH